MAGNTLALRVDVDAKNVGALDNIGSKLAKGTVQLAKFAAGAAAAGAAFGYFAAGFASDLNESLSKVGVVFGDSADEIEDWSETAAESMGLSQQAALEAAGTFGNLFSAMDIGVGPTKDMSKGLVELAADLASFNNMDPTEVLEKLRAGVSGEAEPLRALGVNISQVRTEAKALELGLWDGIGAISASAKAQANYALIMEDSILAQGDFARTSEGMANQQRIVAATFQDTMADVGQAFIPIIESILPRLVGALQGVATWVTDNGPAIQGAIETAMDTVGEVIGAAADVIVDVVENVMPTLNEAFRILTEEVIPAFGAALSVAIPAAVDAASAVLTFLSKEVLPRLSDAIDFVRRNWAAFGPFFQGVAITLAGLVGGVLTTVFYVWAAAALTAAIGTVIALGPVILIIGAIALAVGAFIYVWNNFRDDIIRIGQSIAAGIGGVFEGIGQIVTRVFGAVVGTIRGAINGVIRIINGAIAGINRIQVHIDVAGVKVDWNGLNLGMIPYLAHGGIVTGPTLAMIGEAGPEAVVPLDRGFGRAAPTIIINTGVGDPVAIGREVVEALQAYERHNGIGWRAAT